MLAECGEKRLIVKGLFDNKSKTLSDSESSE